MSDVVMVESLSVRFGEDQVLRKVTRGFEEGRIHGIVGNNGSGKTVLMKCVCGFLLPTSGRVVVDGRRVGVDVDFPQDMGLIIETPGFVPNRTALGNLLPLAKIRGRAGEAQVRAAIRAVGLDPDLKKPLGKYSLGMRQRLGIAQAIMEDPCLLVLDEPFNGLDKQGLADMRALLAALRERGKTILLASHSAQDIELLCDTVMELDAGQMRMVRQ